jgi:peptidyl-prolyl cis-trans isomerase C
MELARQTILIRELFADYQKNNPVTDAEIQAEYDKFVASQQRQGIQGQPHPGGEGSEAKAIIAS